MAAFLKREDTKFFSGDRMCRIGAKIIADTAAKGYSTHSEQLKMYVYINKSFVYVHKIVLTHSPWITQYEFHQHSGSHLDNAHLFTAFCCYRPNYNSVQVLSRGTWTELGKAPCSGSAAKKSGSCFDFYHLGKMRTFSRKRRADKTGAFCLMVDERSCFQSSLRVLHIGARAHFCMRSVQKHLLLDGAQLVTRWGWVSGCVPKQRYAQQQSSRCAITGYTIFDFCHGSYFCGVCHCFPTSFSASIKEAGSKVIKHIDLHMPCDEKLIYRPIVELPPSLSL